ncbi:hypothetical protein BLNAU_19368 [Blattamonas nauphoetae]|uniref:Uncharacterized protein n=1 Tax=Blattamonas nauphoetae TaxID=2049346 RepID=A0ABQ9X2W9_9EUKA|nr:hypothetical protein BLNAU_19368 [Blattamonas nauphoetae]
MALFSLSEIHEITNILENQDDQDDVIKALKSIISLCKEGSTTALTQSTIIAGLISVIEKRSPATQDCVNFALASLAELTADSEGQTNFATANGLTTLQQLIEECTDKTKKKAGTRPFPLCGCQILSNVADRTGSEQTMIDAKLTGSLVKLLHTSAKNRPVAAITAARLLTKLIRLQQGKDEFVLAGGYNVLQSVLRDGTENQSGKPEVDVLLESCCLLVEALAQHQDCISPILSTDIVPMVCALPILRKDTPDTSIAKACILALFPIILDETGSEVVCGNADLTVLYNLLNYTLQVPHNDEVDTKAITKSCLGIGGLYGSDMACPITPTDIITKLNKACMKYATVDAETIFMVTSLVVHIGSFDGGPEALQVPASIETAAKLMEIYLDREKTEVNQSIIRNECVCINNACTTEDMIKAISERNIFDMILRICQMYAELNSEIIETILTLLSRIASTTIGKQEVNKVPFTAAFRDILDYFTNINVTDDRRDSIIFLIKQLQDVLPK